MDEPERLGEGRMGADAPSANRSLFYAWILTVVQRFIIVEPLLVVLGVIIPMTLASRRCSLLLDRLFPCCVEQMNSGLATCMEGFLRCWS